MFVNSELVMDPLTDFGNLTEKWVEHFPFSPNFGHFLLIFQNGALLHFEKKIVKNDSNLVKN